MKAAIITLNGRITLGQHNIRSIDIAALKAFVASRTEYRVIDYVSTTKKRLKEGDPESVSYFKDSSATSLLEYDDIYIYNSTANFIGGAIQSHTVRQIKEISRHKGRLFYVQTDPQLHLVNLAFIIYNAVEGGRKLTFPNEQRLSKEDVERFSQQKWTVLYNGRNYEKYTPFYHRKVSTRDRCLIIGFEYVDYFEKLYASLSLNLPNSRSISDREFDLVYYGNWRPERAKTFKKYFLDNGLKNYFIGIKDTQLPNAPFLDVEFCDYIDHSLLGNEVNRAIASVVIGDPTHGETQVKTARFFENIKSKVVSFIDLQYDPQRTLYRNNLLRDHLYVNDGLQVAQKLQKIKQREGMFERILELQLQELEPYK